MRKRSRITLITIILASVLIIINLQLADKFSEIKKQNEIGSENNETEEIKEDERELEELKAEARDNGRLSDLRQIQNQLEIDYFSSSSYPDNIKGYLDASEDSVPVDYNGNTYKYYPIDSNNYGQNNGYEIGVCMEDINSISVESSSCSNISCSPNEGELLCFKIVD